MAEEGVGVGLLGVCTVLGRQLLPMESEPYCGDFFRRRGDFVSFMFGNTKVITGGKWRWMGVAFEEKRGGPRQQDDKLYGILVVPIMGGDPTGGDDLLHDSRTIADESEDFLLDLVGIGR